MRVEAQLDGQQSFEESFHLGCIRQGARCTAPCMRAGVVPSATMQTSEGRWVIIGGNGDSVYSRLMTAVGRPDMGADNPLYATNAARCEREAEIYEVSFFFWGCRCSSLTADR
jgi:crotonobetainyl-CoA:carnitine CoA-transferase CaiB-like acyl-CoA transferase